MCGHGDRILWISAKLWTVQNTHILKLALVLSPITTEVKILTFLRFLYKNMLLLLVKLFSFWKVLKQLEVTKLTYLEKKWKKDFNNNDQNNKILLTSVTLYEWQPTKKQTLSTSKCTWEQQLRMITLHIDLRKAL